MGGLKKTLFRLAGIVILFLAVLVFPGQAAAQTECPNLYLIRRGDTLGKIAKKCGTTIDQLLFANPQIKNPHRIFAGQKLNLPAKFQSPQQAAAVQNEVAKKVVQKLDLDQDEHWIDVDLSDQMVYAMKGQEVVRSFVASTGTRRYPTVTGEYRVYLKYRYDDMRGPGYYLKDVPYTMYFHKGYGLHGTYWHNNFGTPMSHGCVNLSIEDAAWMFDFATLGTLVNVHP